MPRIIFQPSKIPPYRPPLPPPTNPIIHQPSSIEREVLPAIVKSTEPPVKVGVEPPTELVPVKSNVPSTVPQEAAESAVKLSPLAKTILPLAGAGLVASGLLRDEPLPTEEQRAGSEEPLDQFLIKQSKQKATPIEPFDFKIPEPPAPDINEEAVQKLAKASYIMGITGNSEASRRLFEMALRTHQQNEELRQTYQKNKYLYDTAKTQAGALWAEGVKIGHLNPEYGAAVRSYAQTGQLEDAQQLVNSWSTMQEQLRGFLLRRAGEDPNDPDVKKQKIVNILIENPKISFEKFIAEANRIAPLSFNRDQLLTVYSAKDELIKTQANVKPNNQDPIRPETLDKAEYLYKNNLLAPEARKPIEMLLRQYGRLK